MHFDFAQYHRQRGFIPIFIAILVAVLAIGGYFVYRSSSLRTGEAGVAISPSPSANPVIPSSTANPMQTNTEETANWKTYTNTKRGYEFKYQDSYKLGATEVSQTQLESVYLTKDTDYTAGGGFAGSDVLRDGVVNSFTIFPNKDLSEAELKSEFGNDITIKNILIGGKNAIEILFPPNVYPGRNIFYKYSDGMVLNISSYAGFEVDISKQKEYSKTFDQILSTFKFTLP